MVVQVSTLGTFSVATNDLTYSTVVIDTGGNIIGVRDAGGANDQGALFEISATTAGYGQIDTIFSFDGTTDPSLGYAPYSELVSDQSGDIIGETQGGQAGYFQLEPSAGAAPTPVVARDGSGPQFFTIDANGNLFSITTFDHSLGTLVGYTKSNGSYAATTHVPFGDGNLFYPSGAVSIDNAGNSPPRTSSTAPRSSRPRPSSGSTISTSNSTATT